MISEVDLRDWEQVSPIQAKKALENLDDYSRMAGITPIGAYNTLKEFIEQVERIQQKQVRSVAALLRKPEV